MCSQISPIRYTKIKPSVLMYCRSMPPLSGARKSCYSNKGLHVIQDQGVVLIRVHTPPLLLPNVAGPFPLITIVPWNIQAGSLQYLCCTQDLVDQNRPPSPSRTIVYALPRRPKPRRKRSGRRGVHASK